MHHMLKQLGGANPPEVTADALARLRAYSWPGNVRQLRNCLERAILLSNEGLITPNELPPEVARSVNGAMPFVPGPTAVSTGLGAGSSALGAVDSGGLSGTGSLRDVEKQQIIAALEQTGWHRGKAAEMLGISPSTLYRRLRDYNLEGRLR
jgi:DNA-binding NtrC family response regulator